MEELAPIIEQAWGWTGIAPLSVLERSAFGNLLVLDRAGRYWRICPEDLACSVVAENSADYSALRENGDFRLDWEMVKMREVARNSVGQIANDQAYCLKIPSVLGGAYDAPNLGKMSLRELISTSGDLARQIKDAPDGTSIKLQITDD